MKKITLCFFTITIIFLSSCNGKTNYGFLYPEDDIISIEIGYVEDINVNDEITQEFIVIKTLMNDKFSLFLGEFNDVACFKYYTDPGTLRNESNGIKITYINGDFEIIGKHGQAKYKDGNYRTYGYYYFDDDMFQELLDNWSN